MPFSIDVVTPDRVVLREEATSLIAPGVLGGFGVLSRHAPMMSELAVGELRYRNTDGAEFTLAVGAGFIQIANNRVTVLADSAERAEEIDLDRARRALDRARDELREAQAMVDAQIRAEREAAFQRAQNRIKVAGDR
jgi:F-type H+-transporting ATPase subunit epsilon